MIALGVLSLLVLTGQATPQDTAALASDYAKASKLLGEWEGDNRQLEEARKLLYSIIGRKRDYAPAFVGLSRLELKAAYIGRREYDRDGLERARKFADHALKLDPNVPLGHVTRAYVAINQHDLEVASNELDRAEEQTPSAAVVRLGRASIAREEGNAREIVRWANEALAAKDATDLNRISAYGHLASTYEGLGAIEKADTAHRQGLRLRPNSAWGHGNYADFLLRRGRVEEAVTEAERAVKLMQYPAGLMTLVKAYVARANELWDARQYDAAGVFVEKAARIAAGDADAFYILGTFYERASKKSGDHTLLARATTAYKKALELNPEHAGARNALRRIAP